jgi:hypothetical protein
VKERFLFHGIYLKTAHVRPRDVKFAVLIEPYFADAVTSIFELTPVAAGKTFQRAVVESFVQFSFADVLLKYFLHSGRHLFSRLPFVSSFCFDKSA